MEGTETDLTDDLLTFTVRCDCMDVRHTVALDVYPAHPKDPHPSAFLHVTAQPWNTFWGRVRAAFQYVFRKHELSYASVCLTRGTATQLRKGLDAFLAEPGASWPHETKASLPPQ